MEWQQQYRSQEHAEFYANKRDATLMRRISNYREQNMVWRALKRVHRHAGFHQVLDCASGTGRFLPILARFDVSVVALDASKEMLEQGRREHHLFGTPPGVVVASALDIPLEDKSVDLVLCARLIHHFPDPESRVRILREFARVARQAVVITFFDSCSYRGWRRTKKKRRPNELYGRYAISRAQCEQEGREAGLKLLGMNALLRFHTEITAAAFVVSAANTAAAGTAANLMAGRTA